MIDKLTKIPSLGALEEAIESFSHPKLMLIDLKNFKELNLKYSDEVGDFVLKEFAKKHNTYYDKKAKSREIFYELLMKISEANA